MSIDLIIAKEFLANHVPAVKLVFDSDAPYIVSGCKKIAITELMPEEEMLQILNKKFKVYFSALSSSTCCHVFNIRA